MAEFSKQLFFNWHANKDVNPVVVRYAWHFIHAGSPYFRFLFLVPQQSEAEMNFGYWPLQLNIDVQSLYCTSLMNDLWRKTKRKYYVKLPVPQSQLNIKRNSLHISDNKYTHRSCAELPKFPDIGNGPKIHHQSSFCACRFAVRHRSFLYKWPYAGVHILERGEHL